MYLPAGISGMYMRQSIERKSNLQETDSAIRRRNRKEQKGEKCKAQSI